MRDDDPVCRLEFLAQVRRRRGWIGELQSFFGRSVLGRIDADRSDERHLRKLAKKESDAASVAFGDTLACKKFCVQQQSSFLPFFRSSEAEISRVKSSQPAAPRGAFPASHVGAHSPGVREEVLGSSARCMDIDTISYSNSAPFVLFSFFLIL